MKPFIEDVYYGVLYKDLAEDEIKREGRISGGFVDVLVGAISEKLVILTTYHKVSFVNDKTDKDLISIGYKKLTSKPLLMSAKICLNHNKVFINISGKYNEITDHELVFNNLHENLTCGCVK